MNDAGLLGRVHQADRQARQHRPQGPGFHGVPPGTGDGRERKEHQQHFLHVIAAVVHHGRRQGRGEAEEHLVAVLAPAQAEEMIRWTAPL
mgnify:CR=1 FL=1